jgi:hypothetical protein
MPNDLGAEEGFMTGESKNSAVKAQSQPWASLHGRQTFFRVAGIDSLTQFTMADAVEEIDDKSND